ncbi:MAG: DUF4333 domain-containing protein [Mycobacterium sp.]
MTVTRGFGAVMLTAALALSLGVAGCSSKGDNKAAAGRTSSAAATGAPSMSAADLQKSLTGRISTATPPKSVTCPNDLPGEVGKTESCEVVVDDNTAVQVNVTVTKVSGSNIDYDFTPAMTKTQLENAFSAEVKAQVSCDGGLDGKVGSSTTCHVTKDGTTDDTAVSVSKVQGLFMSLSTGPS